MEHVDALPKGEPTESPGKMVKASVVCLERERARVRKLNVSDVKLAPLRHRSL